MTGIESIPQTMYQTDFQPFPIQEILSKRRQQKSSSEATAFRPIERSKYRPVQMDMEILQPFKPDANVPFNLMHREKSILHQNPQDPIPKIKLEDKQFQQKLESRNQRSAVYMTPQINFDKIPENIMYGENQQSGLVSSIYSSDWKKACEFAVQNSPLKFKDDPTKKKFTKEDIIQKTIEKTRFKVANRIPAMEIGLEKYISTWEQYNPVEFVDTTKLFWDKHKEIGLCPSCESQEIIKPLTDEESKELDNCLKEDALRTPFTLHPPGYTGYVPRLAAGIQFRKKKFTKYDNFVTTLMAAQGAIDKNSV